MKIVMFTNTYLPIVGGVEKSIEDFSRHLESRGHDVLIVTTKMKGYEKDTKKVIRLPSISNFNNTPFAFHLPIPAMLNQKLNKFNPDIVHTHHPFLIGDTALRYASQNDLPIVFTHHTLYERYVHYVPGNKNMVRKFVKELAKGFSNLCDCVIAPTKSVGKMLKKRGVKTPIKAISTGIDFKAFKKGDRDGFRVEYGIEKKDRVLGFVSRIAEEKNVEFLKKPVARILKKNKQTKFLLVGDGPQLKNMLKFFKEQRVSDQVISTSVLQGQKLIDAYHAMDVFVFASKSETQGIVLAEAMAAGNPVVALSAYGVKDVVVNQKNGVLLKSENIRLFVSAVEAVLDESRYSDFSKNAITTAKTMDMVYSVDALEKLYLKLIKKGFKNTDPSFLEEFTGLIKGQWKLFFNLTNAAQKSFGGALLGGGD